VINILSLAYAEYKSANIRFWLVVQLFAPPTNLGMHLPQKIPFINAMWPFCGCQQCAHKYWSLVGLVPRSSVSSVFTARAMLARSWES